MAGKVDGTNFNFYGVRRFFYFFSYYDALRATNLNADLSYIQDFGFDGIRIMLNWFWTECSPPCIFNSSGGVNSSKLSSLKTVLETAENKGMIVDITFLLPDSSYNSCCDGARMSAFDLSSGIKSILGSLKSWKDSGDLDGEWIIDLGNEHTLSLFDWDESYVRGLRLVIQNYFGGDFPCTASTTGTDDHSHCSVSNDEGTNVIAPHFRTGADWYKHTETRTKSVISCANGKPVYLQEPERSPYVQSAEHFHLDCDAARNAGAAGWCFHTDAGFVLKGYTLRDILHQPGRRTDVELEALEMGFGGGGENTAFSWVNLSLFPWEESFPSPSGGVNATENEDGSISAGYGLCKLWEDDLENTLNLLLTCKDYADNLLTDINNAIIALGISDLFDTMLENVEGMIIRADDTISPPVRTILNSKCIQDLLPLSLRSNVEDFSSAPGIIRNKFLDTIRETYNSYLDFILPDSTGQAIMLVKRYEDWISKVVNPAISKVEWLQSCLELYCMYVADEDEGTDYALTYRGYFCIDGNHNFGTSKFGDWNPVAEDQLQSLWSETKKVSDNIRDLDFGSFV